MGDGIVFRQYPGFGVRNVMPTNLARYAAMMAGDEWIGTFQYGNARTAYIRTEDATGDEAAALSAANLCTQAKELPAKGTWCDNPKPEEAWYAACELFALASQITPDEADTQLREDFKYYLQVSVALIRGWREKCEAGELPERCMDFTLWRHLTAFMLNECGVDVDVYTNHLKDSHHRSCTCGKRR